MGITACLPMQIIDSDGYVLAELMEEHLVVIGVDSRASLFDSSRRLGIGDFVRVRDGRFLLCGQRASRWSRIDVAETRV